MNSEDRINRIFEKVERLIRAGAENGFFAAKIYWTNYGISPNGDDAVKKHVKDTLRSRGYQVVDKDEASDYIFIHWMF